MKRTTSSLLTICCFFSLLSLGLTSFDQSTVSAQEPNWYPYVFARGEDRQILQAMPLHQRPYRPLHVYGNSMRRTYYRGTPVPLAAQIGRLVQAPLAIPRVLGDRLAQQTFRRF